jgi:type VI secretion system secreted protein Hcp
MSLTSGSADGETDVFLHVQTKRAGKVKGEATTNGHTDDIEVHAWTFGVQANSAIGATAATARRTYRTLNVVKGIDAASTALMSALVTNDEVKEATLAMRKAGGEALDYFRMTLQNARIVSIDMNVDTAGRPIETVAIAFTKIEVEYKKQQSLGGISGGSYTFTDELIQTG